MSDLPTTIKRYPRTLVEAFGCDAESARAIHGPYRKPQRLWHVGLVAVLSTLSLSFFL